MKRFFPSVTLSIYLFLSFTTTGSFRLNWLQTYYKDNGEPAYQSSMEMEGIQVAATYNKPVLEFKQSWAKGNISSDHWSLFNVFLSKYFSAFKGRMLHIHEELGFKGNASVQCWAGCPSSLEDIEDFSYKVALNAEYELHLDLTRKVWVAESNPLAQAIQEILQKDKQAMNDLTVHVTNLCMQLANLFSQAGKEVFSRKIQPQVYITSQTDKSETEVICMVTGFYPKPINVSLWKENTMDDVLSTEILPNGDWTYQITLSTTVNVMDQQSIYCRVEHSSLKEPLIVYLDKKAHFPTGLLVGITISVAVGAVALAHFIKKYKRRGYDNTLI